MGYDTILDRPLSKSHIYYINNQLIIHDCINYDIYYT